jgi:hypothetical protein
LTYDSEAWSTCKREENRITAAEMKFIRRTARCIGLGYKNNLDMMKELDTQLIMEFIENYR